VVAASTRHISHSGRAHLRCIKYNIVAVIQRRRSRPGEIPGHQQPATPRTSSPPGTTYPRPPNPVLHLMQLSPEYEPGHRPAAAPPPAPPVGQPFHDPEPTAVFRVRTGRAKFRHPRTASVGDLHPHSGDVGRDRDRDRLPGKTRAAVAQAVGEKLAREQYGIIPARVPRAEYRAHERADNPDPLHQPGNLHALANRHPSHQFTAFPPPGKTRWGPNGRAGKCTLTSAAIVKPTTRRWRATPRAQPGELAAHTAGENQAIRAGGGIPRGNSASRRIPIAGGNV
jgi:hypothetical protein